MATAAGNFRFTCSAPCTSISSTRSRPLRRASSSHLRGVPYRCLPKTRAYSRNSPWLTLRSNSASDTKSYHFPALSVSLGGRVVHEMENIVPGTSSIFFTSVDLPEPDGPETMNTSGCCAVLNRHSTFCACSRSFSMSDLTSSARPVIARPSDSTPGVLDSSVFASRCISCNRKSSFLPASPAPASSF